MSDPTAPHRPRPSAGEGNAWQRLQAWLTDPEALAAGQLPRFFLLFLMLFGVGMILISLVGDQGLIAYYGLRRDAEGRRRDGPRLGRGRREVSGRRGALRGDPECSACRARERLGRVKPGGAALQLPRPGPRP